MVIAFTLERGPALPSPPLRSSSPLPSWRRRQRPSRRRRAIGTTFIGTSLVATETSLPELVSSLAAVRLGAIDLAVGNLFGSNVFNMGVLFLLDVVHRPDPLLSAVSSTHTIVAPLSMVLMSLGLMGIVYRVEKRFLFIEPDNALRRIGRIAGNLIGIGFARDLIQDSESESLASVFCKVGAMTGMLTQDGSAQKKPAKETV